MPTYEYRCPNGHEFERFFRTISGAPAEVACPDCQAIAVRQLSGGAGLLFKGSGFYLTDYGKNAHRKAELSTEEGKKGEGKKAEGDKSESKSEAAPKADGGASKSESTKPKADTPKKTKTE